MMEIFWTMLASQDRKCIREYIVEQNLIVTRLERSQILYVLCLWHTLENR